MPVCEFGLVGTGWRSLFFLRIAASLPEQFRVSGLVSRTPEKHRQLAADWRIQIHSSIDELLRAHRPKFVVVSVPPAVVVDVLTELAGRQVPVLSETPPAKDLDGLNQGAALARDGARIQVAEQYFLQPTHAARLAYVKTGRLGTISYAAVSVANGYHGVSLIRKYLGVGFESAAISARSFSSPIVGGPGRGGPPAAHRIDTSVQTIAEFDFGDRLGLYDFTRDQNFSWIRSPRVMVRGGRGEIKDDEIRYLEDHQSPVMLRLTRQDAGQYANLEGYHHKGILAGAEWMYRNPFAGARLSDDEIAVASCLQEMSAFVETGHSFYSLPEAAQDQYLALIMEEAQRTGRRIASTPQAWHPR